MSTSDQLRVLLGDSAYRALELLSQSNSPVSGRAVSRALRVSPTTASAALARLKEAGFVDSVLSGRSTNWYLLEANPTVRSWIDERKYPGGASLSASRPVFNAVILTAIQAEYSAVVAHLPERRSTRVGTTRFEVGDFAGDACDWKVHVCEIGPGNAAATREFVSAADGLKPQLVLFVGIAGSVKPLDVVHGDVVVAERVYNAHSGKDTTDDITGESVHRARPMSYPASYGAIQLPRAVRRKAWTTELTSMDPGAVVLNGNGKTPKVEIRAIAAGEVVVADDRSQLMQKIRRQLDDVAAVDMESFGVYETAHARQLPALAIRGISDCVGDKRADADAGWQPRAASYAAAFAFALLRAAEPEDLPGSATPGPPRPVSEEGPSPSSRDLLFGLPPNLWATYDWALQRVGDPATDVLRQLVSLGEQPATWLSRIRHRTPPMLQARDSMPQWLLVAEFANAHEHQISSWLYEQAAERTTDSVERAFLFARAAVVAQRDAGIDKAESLLGKAEAEEPSARPLWRLYDAALHQNIPEVLEQVQVLMRPLALGLSASVVDALGPVDEVIGDDDAAFVAFISEFNEQHPQLLDQLRVHVALIAGNALLISGKLDAAQMLFENLLNGLPALDSVTRTDLIGARSSTVLIQIARTLLTRIANMSSKEVGLDTDGVLARAEELALTARDRRLDWHGPTGEALAMAAHARARSGDTRGALHLLSPPPRGIALPSEASSQPVLQFAAELAVGTGDIDLALELAAKIEDAAERNIATGLALTLRPDSHSEAAAAFRTALATPPERIRVDQCVRALLALAMVTTLGEDEFARLEEVDPEVADVIRAQAFMTAGRVSEAQVLARRYPDNDAAVLIRVEGYLSQGKVSEALEALETYGVRHSEDQFFLRAASLAIGSDMPNEALRLAALVVSSSDLTRRRAARELIVDAASRLGDWDRVLTETRRLIEDDDLATSDPDRETNLAKYRWARVHALHQQRHMGAAYRVIRDEPRLTPTDISKGQLVVSVLRSIAPEIHLQHLSGDMTAGVSQEEVLSLALEVAQAFPDDETIVGTALMTSFAMPAQDPPDPLLMTKARQLQQRFFERFPESELIRRGSSR